MSRSPIITRCAECGSEISLIYPSLLRERNYCNRSCLGRYRSKHYVGEKAAHWKGGTRLDRDRVQVLMPESTMSDARGYVYRYRLVAAEMIGRDLQTNEVVHHIDGNASNDDPINLLVMTKSEHASQFDARKPVLGIIPEQCGHGHDLSPDNLYLYERDGLRKWACRTCRRAAYRRHALRQKEAA